MENKFEDELNKIEKLLNKIDVDLSTDALKMDFSTFFKNVDKTFEIYNICLEELCGQLYLLELSSHSKIYRKLYHHYKHQLYNVMKYQLNLQKELNDKTEDEKNYISKIDSLNSKLKTMKEKKSKLHSQIDEQKLKIEKLVIANSQQKENKKYKKLASLEKNKNMQNINFEKDPNAIEAEQNDEKQDGNEKSKDELLEQVNDLLEDDVEKGADPKLKENLMKLLNEIEVQKKKLADLRRENEMFTKKNNENKLSSAMGNKGASINKRDCEMMTSMVLFSEDDHNALIDEIAALKDKNITLQNEFDKMEFENSAKFKELNDYIVEMKEENDGLKQSVEYMDSINKELKNEVNSYYIKEEGFNIQFQNLQSELDEIMKINSGQAEKIKDLEEINQTLKEEIDQREDSAKIIEEREGMLEELSRQNSELIQKIEEFEEIELDKEVPIDDKIKSILDNKSNKISMLEKEINKLIKVNKEIQIKLNDEHGNRENIEENFKDISLKYQEALKQIEFLKTLLSKVQKSMVDEGFAANEIIKKSLLNINNNDNRSLKKSSNRLKTENRSHLNVQGTESSHRKRKPSIASIGDEDKKSLQSIKHNAEDVAQEKLEKKQSSFRNAEEEKENFELTESDEKETSRIEEEGKEENVVEKLLNMIGADNFNKLKGDADTELQNDSNLENCLKDFLKQEDNNANVVKITCNRAVQCDYMSAVDYIRENRDLVVYYENDFEKIKEAIDILAEIIGYSNLEDYTGEGEYSIVGTYNKMPSVADSKLKMSSKGNKNNKNKVMPVFQQKNNKFKLQNKIKQTTKFDKSKLNHESESEEENDSNKDNKRGRKLTKSNLKKFRKKMKEKKNRIVMPQDEDIEEYQDEMPEFGDLNGDYIIQKNKIITNDNNQRIVEVVDYVKVPKQLQISKSKLNPNSQRFKFKRAFTFERKVLSLYEKQQRNKEKIYFRMYLNLKKRYQFRPEDFIRIYKIYFNKRPEFAERINEDYDPEEFLFNFNEFKEHFINIMHIHQSCGANCVHLKRFYEKSLTQDTVKRAVINMKNQVIDKLPDLIADKL